MNKKRVIFLSAFVLGAAFLILCLLCHKRERVRYGEDIEVIQAEFPDIPGIESCRYKTEVIGNPYFPPGPTSYHLTAVIIIDGEEMKKIAIQYEGEKGNKYSEDEQIKIAIERSLVENTDIDDESVWTFNQDFRMEVLGWRYVGEVYYLEEENAIYLDVENL